MPSSDDNSTVGPSDSPSNPNVMQIFPKVWVNVHLYALRKPARRREGRGLW
jgi:hypothetical protein